ncbi:MAG: hypothetical protein M3281_04965 [Chloroflexota bacterium]|nr:hypothetical protein [Chloroflexota bacterium]
MRAHRLPTMLLAVAALMLPLFAACGNNNTPAAGQSPAAGGTTSVGTTAPPVSITATVIGTPGDTGAQGTMPADLGTPGTTLGGACPTPGMEGTATAGMETPMAGETAGTGMETPMAGMTGMETPMAGETAGAETTPAACATPGMGTGSGAGSTPTAGGAAPGY